MTTQEKRNLLIFLGIVLLLYVVYSLFFRAVGW